MDFFHFEQNAELRSFSEFPGSESTVKIEVRLFLRPFWQRLYNKLNWLPVRTLQPHHRVSRQIFRDMAFNRKF